MEKGSFLSEGRESLVEAKLSMRFLKFEIGAKGLLVFWEISIWDGIMDGMMDGMPDGIMDGMPDGDVDVPKKRVSNSFSLTSSSAKVEEEVGGIPVGVLGSDVFMAKFPNCQILPI